MSIFKDTFRGYVRDQLSLREEIINIGNPADSAIPGQTTTLNRYAPQEVTLQTDKTVTIPGGGFYNYTLNKQCIIRATSLVDYVEPVNLDIGGLEGADNFKAFKGAALSRNFILEGGVLSDFARDGRNVRRVTTPRDSFQRPGQRTNLAYGDFAIGADANEDGYGIVPMPGIIDINVRTKSAYGSLREAKVNFECHNRRQLEVLEMLYMRPGYMVLLEWGWTPYINNDGQLYKDKRLMEDITNDRIYTTNITQQEVFNRINELKEFHCGNYDGFLGFVKNFGFRAREDGGFSCYTELISMGEVLDSLKMPNISILNPVLDPNSSDPDEGNITISTTTEYVVQTGTGGVAGGGGASQTYLSTATLNSDIFNEALEKGIFPRYSGLLGLVKGLANYAVFNDFSTNNPNSIRNSAQENNRIEDVFGDIAADSSTIESRLDSENGLTEPERAALRQRLSDTNRLSQKGNYGFGSEYSVSKKFLRDLVRYQATDIERYLTRILNVKDKAELRNYIIPTSGRRGAKLGSNQSYIRWDALCTLINENLITKDEKANHPVKVVSDRVYKEQNNTYKIDPLLFAPVGDYTNDDANTLIDFSADATTCILPLQFFQNEGADGSFVDLYAIEPTLGYIPKVDKFPVGYIVGSYDPEDKAKFKYDNKTLNRYSDVSLTDTDRLRRIGSIYINISMIEEIAEKNADNDEYTVGRFLKDIWDKVNKACPNHNFVLTDDKESNTIFVIDLPVDNSIVPSNLHTFLPFSNKNILRKFEYTSNVPKAMTATIAIQAQDPRSIQDIDGVTFAAFNRSIKNRILSQDTRSNWARTSSALKSNADSILDKQTNLRRQIDRYNINFFRNISAITNEQTPASEGNISNILKEYQKNAAYLSTVQTGTHTFNSVIPLEFNATLDGISGIVIGNMFKVDKSRLPKAYAKANIGFIVFNEDQKITGQDWVTDISGKMVILPDPKRPVNISGISTSLSVDIPVLTEKGVSVTGKTKLVAGQSAITDIAEVTEGGDVYLKKNKVSKEDVSSIEGATLSRPFGIAWVRNTTGVDNEWGEGEYTDNVRGMFDAWKDGGTYLGKVREIRETNYDNDKVRLLNSRFSTYFPTRTDSNGKSWNYTGNDTALTFIPKRSAGSIIQTIDGVDYYVTDQDLTGELPYDTNDLTQPGVVIPYNTPNKLKYIRVADTTKVASAWYKIAFSEEADAIFKNEWVLEANRIDSDGADYPVTGKLSTYSQTYDCWMRFDTLAGSAESATAFFD